MKIILHIGQSKTGTSAIQEFLTRNRSALLKQGALFPQVQVGGQWLPVSNHNAVSDSLTGFSAFPFLSAEEYFRQFFAQAEESGAHTMILSAEHFFGGEPRVWNLRDTADYLPLYQEKLRVLYGFLQGHEVQVLLYLRPHLDWFASAVGQTVRVERLIRKEPIYQDDQQFFDLLQPVLDYSSLVGAWQAHIGPDNMMVVPYERSKLIEGSSIADFMHRVGLADLQFDYADMALSSNVSLAREYLEVKKRLNLEPKTKAEERIAIRCLLKLSKASPFGTGYALDPAVLARVEQHAEADLQSLQRLLPATGLDMTPAYRADRFKDMGLEDIETALKAYRKERSKLKSHLLYLRFAILSILRENAPALHALMHRAKARFRRLAT